MNETQYLDYMITAEEENGLHECRICNRRRLISQFTHSEDVCDTCFHGVEDETLDYEVAHEDE
jgi:uncharacterized protein (DUF983 family)